MLKMNTIKGAPGARKKRHRVGRGPGSGTGCTAGKGNKGDGSRSGRKNKPYFEGGQTPLTRRIPKRGFVKPFRVHYQIVNVRDLQKLDVSAGEVNAQTLYENGIVHSPNLPVKILGAGDIDKAFTVKADAYSRSAREKLKAAKATVR